MKNSKKCIKCGSDDIIMIPHYSGDGGEIQMGLFTAPVLLNRYLCCSCGFSEEWVEKIESLEKVKKIYKQ